MISLSSLLRPYNSMEIDFDTKISKKLFTCSIDILAVSCACHRIKNSPNSGINTINFEYSLSDPSLLDLVNDTDLEQANHIRKYYGQKIVLWELKSRNLSSFRKTLALFLAENGKSYSPDWIGMIYKLPAFYHYDTQLDSIREKFEIVNLTSNQYRLHSYNNHNLELFPIHKMDRHMKCVKVSDYWFKMSDNVSVCVSIDKSNPLIEMWDTLFHKSQKMSINGNISYQNHSDFGYCSMTKWKILNDIEIR